MAGAVATGAFYLFFMAGAFSIGYPLVRLAVKRSQKWDSAARLGYGAVVGTIAVLAAFGTDFAVSGTQAAFSASGWFAPFLLTICVLAAPALKAIDSAWPKEAKPPARPSAPAAPEPEVKVVSAVREARPAAATQTPRKPQEEMAFASSNQWERQPPPQSPSQLRAIGISNGPQGGKTGGGISAPEIQVQKVSKTAKTPPTESPTAGPVRRKTFEEIMDEMGIK